MADYYAALGVTRTATLDQIKKAFRKLVKKHHPDMGGDATKFREVKEAYEILFDPEKRKDYDGIDSFKDKMWGDIFGRTSRPDFKPRKDWSDAYTYTHKAWQHRGSDIYFDLVLTFEEMCNGCVKQFAVTRRVVCPECKGKGGEDLMDCEFCEGKGKTTDYLHAECGVCNGKGKVPRKTCIQCAGSGLAPKEQRIKLTLPAGIQPDGTCDLEGYGHETLDGLPGDLTVRIKVIAHEFFRRSGLDIQCTLKVNALRAILGGDVTVRTIHGDRTLTIPPGTQNGYNAILEGEGIHTKDRQGSQHVRMKIIIPVLTPEEKGELTEMLIDKIVKHSPDAELEPIKEALRW